MYWLWKLFVSTWSTHAKQERPVAATCACCGKDIRIGDMLRHHSDGGGTPREGALRWDEHWAVGCMTCAEMSCDGTGRLELADGKPIARVVPFDELYALHGVERVG